MIDFDEVFNDSYRRVMANPREFFDEFYRNFMGKSDEIRDLFSGTDMERQKEMLTESLAHLISFFVTKKADDYLIEIADLHRNKLKVTPKMYEIWMDSLLETLGKLDRQFDRNAEMGWRVTLSPGIEFMKHYYK